MNQIEENFKYIVVTADGNKREATQEEIAQIVSEELKKQSIVERQNEVKAAIIASVIREPKILTAYNNYNYSSKPRKKGITKSKKNKRKK